MNDKWITNTIQFIKFRRSYLAEYNLSVDLYEITSRNLHLNSILLTIISSSDHFLFVIQFESDHSYVIFNTKTTMDKMERTTETKTTQVHVTHTRTQCEHETAWNVRQCQTIVWSTIFRVTSLNRLLVAQCEHDHSIDGSFCSWIFISLENTHTHKDINP